MGVGYAYVPPLLLQVVEREEATMGREDSRLPLQGLAQRLEALERENKRMRSENAALRHKVATLEGSTKSLSVNCYLEEDDLGASELDKR
jgi:hypothetical protein